jgi:hypothetical protein
MAKKKLRPWTKDDVRMLKTLAREKTGDVEVSDETIASRGGDEYQ